MKILHVETGRHFLGGPQQVVYLINALRERGFDNTLVCPPDSGLDRAARQAGIRVQNLFCAGDLDLPFAYRLAQFLKQQAPDIVHCHSRRGADVLGGLAAKYADIPAVVSRRVDNTEMRLMAAVRYKPFRKIIAISNAIADVLVENGVDAERITVIRSAVDVDALSKPVDKAALKDEFGIPDNVPSIAAAGQLIPRKGHRYLLEAAAGLIAAQQPFRLVIFGDGYLNNQLRAQAASLNLGEHVQFAGFRDDLDSYIGGFDLFVHPALTEGLGVAALKAAAAGIAVVGFDAGGLSEAVDHDKTGLLVEAGSAVQLQKAIATLLLDESRRTTLAHNGRERMRVEFSIDAMVNKHVELYESL